MKKFLTVLLVIAVMFTFSFSSAFATLSSDETDALNQYKAEQAQNYYSTIEKAGENYLNGLTFDAKGNLVTSDGGTGLISKDVVKAAVADAVDDAKTAFGQAVSQITPSDIINTNSAILAALQQAYLNVVNEKLTDEYVLGATTGGNPAVDYSKVIKKQFKIDKDATTAALAAYDLSKYSDNIKDYAIAVDISEKPYSTATYTYGDATGLTADASLTAKEFVNKIVSTQTLEVTRATESTDGIKAVRKAAQIADELINGHKITTSESYYVEAVKTLDDLKADTSLESTKANAIAQIKAALASKKIEMANKIQDGIDALNKYATLSDSNKALLEDLNEDKANLDENFANEEAYYTAKVNYQETTATVKSYLQTVLSEVAGYANASDGKVAATTENIFKFADTVADTVKKLEADAALLAQQKDVNGQLYYDKAVLDANLADAIKAVYMDGKSYDQAYAMLSGGNEATVINAKIDYINFITGETTSLQPKDSKGKTVTEKWNKATANSVDGAKGNVAVLKSGIASATGYAVAPEKMYDKVQKDALKTLVADTKKAIEDAKTVGEIEKIFAEANDKYEEIATTKDHKDAWAASGKVGLAYTKADYDKELKAYADYFVAKVDSSAYPMAVNSSAKVLEEVAYPIVYKAYTADELADKVAEAKAAIDSILTKDALKAKKAEVEAAIKALPGTIALTDKDAITAAADALDDYNDIPGSSDNPVTNTGVLTAAEKAYEKLAAKELDDAYKALNAKKDITVADKEAIEALRALYDAHDDFVTNYNNKTNTATTTENGVKALEKKLSDAKVAAAKELMIKLPANPTTKDKAQVEAARAAYDALTLEEKAQVVNTLAYKNLIDAEEALGLSKTSDVEALKITAKSTAKKGSITVKWTVKGDKSGVEAYEIWKSTKKNAGFKKAFTTTKQTYKNTKGLKKGTRYYYKVRAIAHVDGKKVASDWSNKAIRKAK